METPNSELTGGGVSYMGLDQMLPGQCGTVRCVEVVSETAGQLMAMGVCEGRKIEVVKRGDPLIIRVLGSRIGVSARLASGVQVEVCASPG